MKDNDAPHKATALRLNAGQGAKVLAQGKGELALRMEQLAREHDIHILQDFALSQNLSRVPVGDVIPDPVFRALSVVLDFIFTQEAGLQELSGSPAAGKNPAQEL